MSEPWSDDPTRLSRDEIENAIKSLTAAEQTAIMKVARQYARMTPYGAEDLLQEVRLRAIDERRAWPRGLPPKQFFWGVIRSIAWEWKRKDALLDKDIGDKGAGERGTLAKIDMVKIITLFDDDPIAQNIVIGMMDGARGKDLQQESGLSPTEYESKRKKIRRRIEKFIEKLKT